MRAYRNQNHGEHPRSARPDAPRLRDKGFIIVVTVTWMRVRKRWLRWVESQVRLRFNRVCAGDWRQGYSGQYGVWNCDDGNIPDPREGQSEAWPA